MSEDTRKHIDTVQKTLALIAANIRERAMDHDLSKLESPEAEVFAEFTPKLAGSTYNSEEYKGFLKEMKPALDHHYKANSHHPEHFKTGIEGMNILDLVEMLADWKAATMRHKDGDLNKSIEINTKRFNMSPQLANIFKNSVNLLLAI